MSRVADRVWLGSFFDARRKPELLENGVTHVVCCAQELPLLYPDSFHYLHVQLADVTHQLILDVQDEMQQWVDQALSDPKAVVFFHCAQANFSRFFAC